MDYIEKAKKEIKDNWFKNHVAEIRGSEGLQVIYWEKPGTFEYRTMFVLSDNNIFISGDIGEAVYNLTCSATLKNIKEFDLRYLTRKLTAHSDERWSFNYKKALRELDEWYLERKDDQLDDLDELHEDLREAAMNFSLHEHFKTAVFSIYETTTAHWFDTEEAESVSDFGSELPHQFIAYWVGLQMAINQLEKTNTNSA